MDSDEVEQFDYLFKIVLIGDAGVGKTCIVQRFKSGLFMEQYGSTIGVDFTMKTIVIDDKKVKVNKFFKPLYTAYNVLNNNKFLLL